MKVLIVEPLKKPYEREIGTDLKSMQEVVGGLIQVIYPFEDPEIALVCNDEGKLMNLPYNRVLRDEDGNIYDVIAGTFFLCRAKFEIEKFEELNDKQMKFCKERFRYPELFT